MEVRVVPAGGGWRWIADGFALFRLQPAMWIALVLALGLMWAISIVIPLIGPLLFNLFLPLFFAGMMLGCRQLERGEPLHIGLLFAGFRSQTVPLVTVGGVYLVGTIVVLGIVLASAGGTMLPAVLEKGSDTESMKEALRSLTLALMAGAAAYLPLMMAIWFAPALVLFDGLAPVAAMKLSFIACLKNLLAFLVYGLAIIGLWMVVSLPAVLGPAGAALVFGLLIVSMPILVCSVYVSYREIFNAGSTGGAPGGNRFGR